MRVVRPIAIAPATLALVLVAALATGAGVPVSRPAVSPMHSPLVVPDCRLAAFEKQDVPSRRDGTLLFIGTEVAEGETVAADRLITIRTGSDAKRFRRLREGDAVAAGQLLGQLDDELSRQECGIRAARLASARADLEVAVRTCEEARSRYETQLQLQSRGKGITAEEEVRASKLTWERSYFDVSAKREAVTLAELELHQAETVWRMHQLRSSIAGVVKAVYKNPGEAVHSSETVLQLQNVSRLRVEAMVDLQHLPRLHPGMRVRIEAPPRAGPQQILVDHRQEVSAVAVSKDVQGPLILSASADGTVRVWDRAAQQVRRMFRHPAAVRAVACTPAGAAANWCLTGSADGKARIWDIDRDAAEPIRELAGQHHGAVTSVAFSADGRTCVTGGEDRAIHLCDTATGKVRFPFPVVHGGAITALQFLPSGQIVSTSHDHTLRLWTLRETSAILDVTFDQRSGDVTRLSASPDGRRVLFDHGKDLRLLSLPDGKTEGILESSTGAGNFTTLALYAPQGNLVLTTGATESALQLWRVPAATERGSVVRHLVCPETLGICCACFAPDGSFLAAGTHEGRVIVWQVPQTATGDRLTAQVTLVERAVEASTHQVRLWAELPNEKGLLVPGTHVTMIVEPIGD